MQPSDQINSKYSLTDEEYLACGKWRLCWQTLECAVGSIISRNLTEYLRMRAHFHNSYHQLCESESHNTNSLTAVSIPIIKQWHGSVVIASIILSTRSVSLMITTILIEHDFYFYSSWIPPMQSTKLDLARYLSDRAGYSLSYPMFVRTGICFPIHTPNLNFSADPIKNYFVLGWASLSWSQPTSTLMVIRYPIRPSKFNFFCWSHRSGMAARQPPYSSISSVIIINQPTCPILLG
jgi:hypothetical protein